MIGADDNLVNSYQYDEWGNILKQKESVSNSFKYAGESYDGETGLYYLKARYYDPTTGRFLNEDMYEGQITNPLSMNGYTYTHNNPLRYVDPSGHHAIEASEETMDGWPTSPSASKSNAGGAAGGKGRSTTPSKESGQKKSNQPKPAPKPDSATNADALAAEQRDQVKQAAQNNKSCNCFIAGTKVQTGRNLSKTFRSEIRFSPSLMKPEKWRIRKSWGCSKNKLTKSIMFILGMKSSRLRVSIRFGWMVRDGRLLKT